MKQFIYVFGLISLSICGSSCTKVIDLKLHDDGFKYVIEGNITDEPGSCEVHISKSAAFNNEGGFEFVQDAIVSVQNEGVEVILPEISKGVYKSSLITGIPGHTYHLKVSIGTTVFSGSSTMPSPVTLDSVYITKGIFGDTSNYATVRYTDPAGMKNYYRFIQYVNDRMERTIFWENDDLMDGEVSDAQLSFDSEDDKVRDIHKGDKLTIEMCSIDARVYKFWYSLSSDGATGESSSASPGNPITNIHGGALGYFSAHAVRRRTIIVK